MSERTDWPDDRIDDLHYSLRQLVDKVDTIRKDVDRHDNQLGVIARSGDRRTQQDDRKQDRQWALYLVVLGQIATVLAIILTYAH